MDVKTLKSIYQNDDRLTEIDRQLSSKVPSHLHVPGTTGSAEALIVTGLFNNIGGVHFCVLADKESAIYFLNDLECLNDKHRVYFFSTSFNNLTGINEKSDSSNALFRSEVLNGINVNRSNMMIVTYPEALMEKISSRNDISNKTIQFNKNDSIKLDELNMKLIDLGFESTDYVFEPGQFAVRGGIVDVFSFAERYPYRIELFGEQIDSIRTFDPATQHSIHMKDGVTILADLRDNNEALKPVFDLLPPNTLFWLKESEFILGEIEKVYNKIEQEELEIKQIFIDHHETESELACFHTIELTTKPTFNIDLVVPYSILAQPTFNKNLQLFTDNLQKNYQDGLQNIIVTKNAKQNERMYAIIEDSGKKIEFNAMVLPLNEGFINRDLKHICYTEHQIFNKYNPFYLKTGFKKTKQTVTLKELNTLKAGDYITHIDHGIGKFAGLQKIDANGKQQEAIKIIYRDEDILYVSIHSLHRISKYSGQEGKVPKISKLGSNAWAKLKRNTKKRIKEIAFDIINVYAKRKAEKGFAYSPDTYMQTELEASFIYEDTPDQLKATIEVKKDMENEAPMDRLVCGDVGYGKTEIGIRAAFKAVADNKQVAVMVPTTILTIQHYNTFKERLTEFPCNIEYISRFKTAKQQKEIVENLKNGKIDIIIGTHRLAGKDIAFKDLGLLIIDEEQKFGVNTKDKLKTIKTSIDTLTLTATPIPRTLEFSMLGARDLSILNTAPPNRYPIATELHTFTERLIADAISYEVQRGGQVFVVNDRIQNIEEIAGLINRVCPNVAIGVVHGRLKGPDLEKVMIEFISGKYDVLVATSIIESGLDIPNANTIIINNAHMFGLSDLHQLRGRVGRSNKKAFCYLLSPPLSGLSRDARTRLKTIEQFAELGSGFNIAMRDLDIRGAGNLLGGEQTGFINDLGFDTYQKILNEAIKELRENEFKSVYSFEEDHIYVSDCQIETDLEILFPDSYINNVTERLSLYKQLQSLKTEEELEKNIEELIDRFGPIPLQANELFNTVRLRWVAKKAGMEKIVLKNDKFIGYFVADQESAYYESDVFTKVLAHVQHHHTICKMKEKNNKLALHIDKISDIKGAIEMLESILNN